MTKDDFVKDLDFVQEYLNLSVRDLAINIGVDLSTLIRWKNGTMNPTDAHKNKFYNYAFERNVRINETKAALIQETCSAKGCLALFHGTKYGIKGSVSLKYSSDTNDFGKGFYCGESYVQPGAFVSAFPNSYVQAYHFDTKGLKKKEFFVDIDWMLMVAHFRGNLKQYKQSVKIKKLLESIKNVDYIVAPIADNRMFEIINKYANGELSDIQCMHCLSATNLGKQYVLRTNQSLKNLMPAQALFLCSSERSDLKNVQNESFKIGESKLHYAMREYRGQGRYIEEILDVKE